MNHTIFKLSLIIALAMILFQANLISRQLNLVIEILMEPIRIERKELHDEMSIFQI